MFRPSSRPYIYTCKACGYVHRRGVGKCDGCGRWNTVVPGEAPAARPAMDEERPTDASGEEVRELPAPVRSTEIEVEEGERISTGIVSLDMVLGGGGVMITSSNLVYGPPGAGKSTLLTQALYDVAARGLGPTLHVTGEENARLAGLRMKRIGSRHPDFYLYVERRLPEIQRAILDLRPSIVVIDSVQSTRDLDPSIPRGSVAQAKSVTTKLAQLAKHTDYGPDCRHPGFALFLINHVTKDGASAGPKDLEHEVDAVFHFEPQEGICFLHVDKNRWGEKRVHGSFEMTKEGLVDLEAPDDEREHEREHERERDPEEEENEEEPRRRARRSGPDPERRAGAGAGARRTRPSSTMPRDSTRAGEKARVVVPLRTPREPRALPGKRRVER